MRAVYVFVIIAEVWRTEPSVAEREEITLVFGT